MRRLYIVIHERLGHLSWNVNAEMLDEDNPLCIRAGITAREVKEIGEKYTCIRVYAQMHLRLV